MYIYITLSFKLFENYTLYNLKYNSIKTRFDTKNKKNLKITMYNSFFLYIEMIMSWIDSNRLGLTSQTHVSVINMDVLNKSFYVFFLII
jgi:hypothetical protein